MRMGMGRNGNEHLGNLMGMGINHKNGNRDGKIWKKSPWKFERMGLTKPIPGHLYFATIMKMLCWAYVKGLCVICVLFENLLLSYFYFISHDLVFN